MQHRVKVEYIKQSMFFQIFAFEHFTCTNFLSIFLSLNLHHFPRLLYISKERTYLCLSKLLIFSFCLSACLPICPSNCLPAYLAACLSARLLAYLPVCPSDSVPPCLPLLLSFNSSESV